MTAFLETLTLAMVLVMCISQVMGKPRPVRDTTNRTEEQRRHTNSTEDPQRYTASTEEPQGHTTSSEGPQGHTTSTEKLHSHIDSTEKLQGHTGITEEPLGYTISTEELQGHTSSTEEPQGHTSSTNELLEHTSSTVEPHGYTTTTEEPQGQTSSTEELQSHTNSTAEWQGHIESTEARAPEHEKTRCGDILTENISTDTLYPSTTTFLVYPFVHPQREYFPTRTPPICPIGVAVSDADQINKVGTCPYDFVYNVNRNRIPTVIKEARCLCKNGLYLNGRMERLDTICRKIMQSMKVLIQDGCDNGYYSYRMEEIQVAVGCLQVIG